MSKRTILFVDDQNVYKSARAAFFNPSTDHFTRGAYDPLEVGRLLVGRTPPHLEPRTLKQVRVYTGRPDPSRQSKAAAAHDKQVLAWKRAGAAVVERPLRYLNGVGQQKGVDVALAIDVVTMAIDGLYDIGIIFSGDSDLRPPIEYVIAKCPAVHVEVAAWHSAHYRQRLSLASRNLWCHRLQRADYDMVADSTDYTK